MQFFPTHNPLFTLPDKLEGEKTPPTFFPQSIMGNSVANIVIYLHRAEWSHPIWLKEDNYSLQKTVER